jgi:predicted Zn-dependent protease
LSRAYSIAAKGRILATVFLFSTSIFAFDQAKTTYDVPLYWNILNVKIKINSQNNDLSAPVARSIILNSIQEWNQASPLQMTESSNTTNQISFSVDPTYFGPGVLAVTRLSYSGATGVVTGAQILINQTALGTDRQFAFTDSSLSSSSSLIYLGDVVTHELGHLQGLSHNEVMDSSMIYSAFKGQATLSADDRSAVQSIYNPVAQGFEGFIFGGSSVPVFGAHIQAFSVRTGKVISATMSEEDGHFILKGLDDEDKYLLYVSPIKNKDQLQSRYQSFRSDFCPAHFVSDFSQGCSTQSKGKPQVFSFIQGEMKNVGVLSIHCSQRLDATYLANRYAGTNLTQTSWSDPEDFTPVSGFFPASQVISTVVQANLYDTYTVDFSARADLAGAGNYLDLKLITQPLFSPLTYEMEISGPFGSVLLTKTSDFSTGQLLHDLSYRYPLSSVASQNVFTVKVFPALQSSTNLALSFPAPDIFLQTTYPYLFIPSLSQGPSGFESLTFWPQSADVNDESSCLQGPFTYSVEPFVEAGVRLGEQVNSEDQKSVSPIACGSLQGPDDPYGGLPSAILGFLATIFLGLSRKYKRKFTLP